MTHKQETNKVFLSKLMARHNGEHRMFFQGRGRCLVDRSVLKKPMHERPVCSVFAIIAKYLSFSPHYVERPAEALATDDAKKRTARALAERFVIRGESSEGVHVSRKELIACFVTALENTFRAPAPRHALEEIILQRYDLVLQYLNSRGTLVPRAPAPCDDWIFNDYHNLIRAITPENDGVFGAAGPFRPQVLRLRDSAMRMFRESIVLDLILSARQGQSAADHLIAIANEFAHERLASGGVISCAQCKKGKAFASEDGTVWFHGRKLVFRLPEEHDDPLTTCPTRGFRPRYNTPRGWPDAVFESASSADETAARAELVKPLSSVQREEEAAVNVGFEIHGGPAYNDDKIQPGIPPENLGRVIKALAAAAERNPECPFAGKSEEKKGE